MESDPLRGALLVRVLEAGGFEAEAAAPDSRSAPAACGGAQDAARAGFDLVLCDHPLGCPVCRGHSVPVIILTDLGNTPGGGLPIRRAACVLPASTDPPELLSTLTAIIAERAIAAAEAGEGRRGGGGVGATPDDGGTSLCMAYRLFVHSRDLLCIVDLDGRFRALNPAWETLGFASREMLGLSFLDFVHPDDRERSRLAAAELRERGRLDGFENRYVARDGSVRWFRWEATASAAEGLLYGAAQDITSSREHEEALRASERRLRSLVECAPDAIILSDRHGRVIAWNPAAQGIFGYEEREILGEPASRLLPERDRDRFERDLADAARMGSVGREIRRVLGLAKDGREIPIESRYTSWVERGEVLFAAVLRDVSERERAEEEREKLIALVENSEDLVVMSSLSGALLHVNRAGLSLLGLDPGELAGRAVFDLVPEGDPRKELREIVIPQLVERGRWDGDRLVQNVRTGRTISLHVSAFLVRRPGTGEPLCLGIVGRNLTELKKLEEQFRQAQKLEAVGRLAGGIAHDFNNLLTAILGYGQLIASGLDPGDPIARDVAEIEKAGTRATALVRKLLAFSRRQVLNPAVLDLNAVILDIEKILRRLIGEDVAIELRLAASLGRVRADAGQVEQIVMNLAVNARDAMPGGGRLTIETSNVDLDDEFARAHAGARAGPHVRVAVSDTGCGMTAEIMAHLFEPFFTTKEMGKGTGLGLSTVYGIIQQSGGSISVSSEPGRGTTFTIHLPRVSEAVGSPAPAAGSREVPRGSETVLLVEDEQGVREVVRRVLERAGYEVLVAENGTDALLLAERSPEPIHLLISDVVMPDLSGPILAQRLAPRHPAMRVLLISGYAEEALSAGLPPDVRAAFLTKPFSPETLTRKVREVLGG